MDELFESVKLILVFLAFAVTAFTLYKGWRTTRNIKTMDRKSNEQLKEIISDRSKQFTFGAAIEELKKRNEDFSEVLPHLLAMSTSKNKADRLLGWCMLETNFPEVTKEIEYDPMQPTEDALQFLNALKAKLAG